MEEVGGVERDEEEFERSEWLWYANCFVAFALRWSLSWSS